MADWDSRDLLARCKLERRRPSIDEFTDDDWYTLLTEAEAYWKPVLAMQSPHYMMSAPMLMGTEDGGMTYRLPGDEVDPMYMEIYRSLQGEEMAAGSYGDVSADYVSEGGGRIRMTGGRSVTFANGPYARFVAAPGPINTNTDSTILPKRARILLVHHACENQASAGGHEDPQVYRDRAIRDYAGIQATLKRSHKMAGQTPYLGGDNTYAWWRPAG